MTAYRDIHPRYLRLAAAYLLAGKSWEEIALLTVPGIKTAYTYHIHRDKCTAAKEYRDTNKNKIACKHCSFLNPNAKHFCGGCGVITETGKSK